MNCPSLHTCLIGTYTLKKNSIVQLATNIQPSIYTCTSYSNQISDFQIYSTMGIILILLLIMLLSFLRNKIELIDIFASNHSYELNAPIILSKTTFGGFFSLIFFVLSLILVGTALLVYSLENIAELKLLQPLPVLQQTAGLFYSDINVTATFAFYGDVCVVNNKCSSDINVVPSDFYILNGTYECQQIDESCLISFICKNCVIGSEASVDFILDSTYSYSPFIGINVSSTSSIPESISSIYSSLTAPENMVFIGPTKSNFYFMLTPSYFSSDISQFPASSTGYHIYEENTPIPGSLYHIEDLPTVTNLGAMVFLYQSTSGLYTKRYYIQTFLILITSILGSIMGILGGTRFLMQQIEKKYIIHRNLSERKRSIMQLKLNRNSFFIIDSYYQPKTLLYNEKKIVSTGHQEHLVNHGSS